MDPRLRGDDINIKGDQMKQPLIICLTVITLAIFFLMNLNQSQAQSSFAGVYPYSPGNGTVGFFDQNSGKIYVYTSDLSQLVREVRLEELGKTVEPQNKSERETYGVMYKY